MKRKKLFPLRTGTVYSTMHYILNQGFGSASISYGSESRDSKTNADPDLGTDPDRDVDLDPRPDF